MWRLFTWFEVRQMDIVCYKETLIENIWRSSLLLFVFSIPLETSLFSKKMHRVIAFELYQAGWMNTTHTWSYFPSIKVLAVLIPVNYIFYAVDRSVLVFDPPSINLESLETVREYGWFIVASLHIQYHVKSTPRLILLSWKWSTRYKTTMSILYSCIVYLTSCLFCIVYFIVLLCMQDEIYFQVLNV